jgi:hypothetical protein
MEQHPASEQPSFSDSSIEQQLCPFSEPAKSKTNIINLNSVIWIYLPMALGLLHSENRAPHSLSSLPHWTDSTFTSLALLPSLVG